MLKNLNKFSSAIAFLFVLTGCDPYVKNISPDAIKSNAVTEQYEVGGSANNNYLQIVELNDGSKCAVATATHAISVDCNWKEQTK